MARKMADKTKCIEMLSMNVLHPRKNKIIIPYKLHNYLLSPLYLGVIIQNDLMAHPIDHLEREFISV